MITRDSVIGELVDRSRPGCPRARLCGLIVAALAVASPSISRASGIFHDLTARDRSQPILLSATGAEISPTASGHGHGPAFVGKIPAYLAFPLDGGEHIPAATPTVASGAQAGETAVGPLALTPSVQATLNADLRTSNGAVVDAPDGSYAVAMLPRYARALAQESSSAGSSTSAASALASMFGLTSTANWTIQGIPTSDLSKWFETGSKEIAHLTSLGTSAVSKTLGIKPTPTTSVASAEAQYVGPAAAAPDAYSVTTPEPSGWLVFAMTGAAALRFPALRRRRRRDLAAGA